MENLNETDNFLYRYHLPKLKLDLLNNLNKTIILKKTKQILKVFKTQKSPRPDGSSIEFFHTFKEDVIPILLTLFHNIETEKNIAKLFLCDYSHRDT